MKYTEHIAISTVRYYPWEIEELQNLIADGLRSLKCNSIVDEIPTPCPECKDCEYKHLCKTLGRVYKQIDGIKAERKFHSIVRYRQNFLKKFTQRH